MVCSKTSSNTLQACYGHTEGAAGLTGVLMATGVASRQQCPGIMCLRNINSYVSAALGDWAQKGSSAGSFAPRQLASGAACPRGTLAGNCL